MSTYAKALPVDELALSDDDIEADDNAIAPPPLSHRLWTKLAVLGGVVTLAFAGAAAWHALVRPSRSGPFPDASVTCELGPNAAPIGFATPFRRESAAAFSHFRWAPGEGQADGASVMRDVYAARQRALCERLRTNESAATLLREAASLGVVVGPLGIDPSAMLAADRAAVLARTVHGGGSSRAAFHAVAEAVVESPVLRAVREAFFHDVDWDQALRDAGEHLPMLPYVTKHDAVTKIPRAALAKRYWQLDVPIAHPPPAALAAVLGAGQAATAARALYEPLSRDGFVLVDRWRGLDVEAITKAGMHALDAAAARDGGTVVRAHSAELEALIRPVLSDEGLLRAVRAYMGPPLELGADAGADAAYPGASAAANASAGGGSGGVCSLGYVALRLTENLNNARRYISSLWHHDRAGRRLKLFIFLNDVDAVEGRPTVVARGTHNSVWYSELTMLDTRFDDHWVRSHHEPVPMAGPRGGGFLFDTNSLHMGTLTGANARNVVIVEIDRPGRCEALTKPAEQGGPEFVTPCPSGPLYPVKETPLSCLAERGEKKSERMVRMRGRQTKSTAPHPLH